MIGAGRDLNTHLIPPPWPSAAGNGCGRRYNWWDKLVLQKLKPSEVMVTLQGEPWLSSVCGVQPKEN